MDVVGFYHSKGVLRHKHCLDLKNISHEEKDSNGDSKIDEPLNSEEQYY
jgi:hypothetical protein